jgi:hypothetical protein
MVRGEERGKGAKQSNGTNAEDVVAISPQVVNLAGLGGHGEVVHEECGQHDTLQDHQVHHEGVLLLTHHLCPVGLQLCVSVMFGLV